MDLVHLLIGAVEGAASVAVVRFVLKTRPEAVFAGPGGRMEAASA